VYFLFPEVDANVSRAFTPAYRVGVGSTAGVLFHLTDRWKMLASGTYLRYPVGDTGKKIRGFFAQQYVFHKNWALRFEFRHEHQDNETTLLLYAYF
jgi:hypothetical protein